VSRSANSGSRRGLEIATCTADDRVEEWEAADAVTVGDSSRADCELEIRLLLTMTSS